MGGKAEVDASAGELEDDDEETASSSVKSRELIGELCSNHDPQEERINGSLGLPLGEFFLRHHWQHPVSVALLCIFLNAVPRIHSPRLEGLT